MKDSIFPIEDWMILLQHGDIKEAHFVLGRMHMGFPEAEKYVMDWTEALS
jgi:hypothetical protein